MARPKPDTKQVQQFILNKAISLIQKQGYPQLTMRRLANDCGMSVGKIYHFFSRKGCSFSRARDFLFHRHD
jgi:AcrR family transcriptional regulator